MMPDREEIASIFLLSSVKSNGVTVNYWMKTMQAEIFISTERNFPCAKRGHPHSVVLRQAGRSVGTLNVLSQEEADLHFGHNNPM